MASDSKSPEALVLLFKAVAMSFEQPAAASKLVADVIRAQCVPSAS